MKMIELILTKRFIYQAFVIFKSKMSALFVVGYFILASVGGYVLFGDQFKKGVSNCC